MDTSTGKLMLKIPKAHRHPINKLCMLTPSLMTTGDDEGLVKLWDMRTNKVAQEYHSHDDFVADILFSESASSLVVAGGDGKISVHDIRQASKASATSDVLDDELLSLSLVKEGKQLIAGSQSGALYLWKWGEWTAAEDKWIGHPSSVDTMCKLDDQAICTGGSDGLLRLVSLEPHRFEGILGDHGEDFPIERVRLAHDQRYLGSCGHDMRIQFWDVAFLFDDENSKDSMTFNEGIKRSAGDDKGNDQEPPGKRVKKPHGDFFGDL
ncbi:WD domain repeat-containing protein 55 [Apophysomyces sp. BC1034]|nr:WD domain repeat-containing protein 55 [Apophysomyces sp. BC1021]KAG0186274.1 WD domain repeat-containing protein 55 [Apophysomyces sp. BC1034]